MPQLTWRNIDAPDFRTSLEGYNQFSQLLNQGIGTASTALKTFDEAKAEEANKAFALKLSSFSDPNALNAALTADPTLGQNPNRISIDSLNGARTRVGDLFNQAATGEKLAENTYAFKRTQDTNANADAARADVAKAHALAASGDEAGASDILKNSPTFNKLSPEQQLSVFNGEQGLVKGTVDIAGGRLDNTGKGINNVTNQFNLSNAKEDRADTKAGQELVSKILATAAGGTVEDQQAAYSGLSNGYSPGAQAAARTQLASLGYNAFAPAAGVGGGSGGPAPSGGTNPNPWTTTLGGGSLPDNVKTVGDVVNYGRDVLIPQTRGKVGAGPDKGASPVGAYQIVTTTLAQYAPKVLGPNWQNQPFTPQAQDAVGKAIFNDNNSSVAALRGQWASLKALPDAQVAAIAKMPWEQARTIIAQRESGASTQSFASLGAQAQIAPVINAKVGSEINKDSFVDKLGPALQDNSPVLDVADRLRGSTFKGTSREFLQNKLQDIMNQTGANASVAATILENSRIVQPSWSIRNTGIGAISKVLGYTSPNLGNGITLDDNRVKTLINQYKDKGSSGLLGRVAQNQSLQTNTANVGTAQNNLAQATAQYQDLARRAQVNPGLAAQLPRYIQRVNDAKAQLQIALSGVPK